MKKKVGIIGCGNVAGLYEMEGAIREKPASHAGAYMLRKDVEIIGCCDKDIKRAKNFASMFKIPFSTNSPERLLSKRPDIVSICVPYESNFAVLKSVVNNKNKPDTILLEKPISDSVAKAEKMVKLCKDNKVRFFVNNRRLSRTYAILKNVIKNEFGNQVISISAWCSSGSHAYAIHMVDILRFLCGDIKWVFAIREKEHIKKLLYSNNFKPCDPRFSALIGFKNGSRGTLLNSARTDFLLFEIKIVCKKGIIVVEGDGKKVKYQKMLKPGKSLASYHLGAEKSIKFEQKRLFKNVINEVIEGNHVHSPINAMQGLESYRVISAMEKSAKTNKICYLKGEGGKREA